ncbi:MAG: hypothetical protein WCH62_01485, partial [Candidatus Omnitrophota bacterium]
QRIRFYEASVTFNVRQCDAQVFLHSSKRYARLILDMKKLSRLLILSFVILVPRLAFCEDPQTITLKDGSQIKGELLGLSGGVYTIHTPSFGDIKINSSQVANIGSAAPMPTALQAAPDDGLNQRVQAAQAKLMSNPQMVMQIQQMMQDPELSQLLSDPSITQAVMSHDLKAIQSNPKAQQLINNPKMRALMDQLRQQ